MDSSQQTCWTLVRGAAAGHDSDRSMFAGVYLPIVRAYLGARFRQGPYQHQVDDLVQDVFVECFREGGALGRADPSKPGRFRTFLYAVVRNVARRHEERWGRERARQASGTFDVAELTDRDEELSLVFDRAWANALLKRAAQRQRTSAQTVGERALRRVELMRLRFAENLPIREIARLWQEDPAVVHREYAKARAEFKAALHEEVAFHNPGIPGEIERECKELLSIIA